MRRIKRVIPFFGGVLIALAALYFTNPDEVSLQRHFRQSILEEFKLDPTQMDAPELERLDGLVSEMSAGMERHDYLLFSVYVGNYTVSHKRYFGIGLSFFELKPEKQEDTPGIE